MKRRAQEQPLGVECALPSRELKLARPGSQDRTPSPWKRALAWLKSPFRAITTL